MIEQLTTDRRLGWRACLLIAVGLALVSQQDAAHAQLAAGTGSEGSAGPDGSTGTDGAVPVPAISLTPTCGPADDSPHTVLLVGTGYVPGHVESLRFIDADGGIHQREVGPADDAGSLRAELTATANEGTTLISVGTAVAFFPVPCPPQPPGPDSAGPASTVAVTTTPGATNVVATPPQATAAAPVSPAGASPIGIGAGVGPGLPIRTPTAAPTTAPATPPTATTTPAKTMSPATIADRATTSGSQGRSSLLVLALIGACVALLALGALLRRRRPAAPPPLSLWPEVVWRKAHLELSSASVPAGGVVAVTVFADAAALADQFPPRAANRSGGPQEGKGRLILHVRLLCSEDLATVEAPGYQTMAVDRGVIRSSDVTFSVRINPLAPDGSILRLTALFSHNNRPCGYLYLDAAIQTATPAALSAHGFGLGALAGPPAGPDHPVAAATAILRIEPGATPPDVLVRVTATQANDGRSFLCEVIARFGTAAHEPEPWNLPDTAPRLVAALMDEFTAEGLTPRHRRDTLVGAGTELYDVAPANFKRTLWALVDGATPPRSIFVCTEEPAIPWELMIPSRDTEAGTEYRQPLGVEFAFGRWVGDPSSDPRLGNPHQAPLQIGSLSSSVIIAPEYTSRDLVLERAPAEVELVIGTLPGTRVTPALYDPIDAGLGATDAGLLHFVGHGRADSRGAHVLVLEKEETLSTTALRGMQGAMTFGRRCHPVVFLNGCEVGRLKPGLAGVDGFAKTLIRQGARCVIAPLWSVTDSIAHEVAVEFYERQARRPDEPLGRVFQEIRRRAYDPESGQDSYAAYAFFGDPLSRAQP